VTETADPDPNDPVPSDSITLEFDLSLEDASRLGRLGALKQSGTRGRARNQAHEIIWLDTAHGDLAWKNRVLALVGGGYHLEYLGPAAAAGQWRDFLPAQPSPGLAEGSDAEALTGELPAPVVPMAGFRGQLRRQSVGEDGGKMMLSLLHGSLRGVAQEFPCARLGLQGPRHSVLGLIGGLAQEICLTVPRASMAAQALAAVRAQVPAARRLGTPALCAEMTLDEAMVASIGWLTDVINHWSALVPSAATPEPVHQMRVALRRMRSLLMVWRRAPGGEVLAPYVPGLRELAAKLGAVRDWDVFLSGIGASAGAAFAGDARVSAMLVAAARARTKAHKELCVVLESPQTARQILELTLVCHATPWRGLAHHDEGRAALAAPARDFGAKALTRLSRPIFSINHALDRLEPDELHDVRKRAKVLRYACDVFAPFFAPKATRKFLQRLADLQEVLGAVNDHHVACVLSEQLPGSADRQYAAGVIAGVGVRAAQKARTESAQAFTKLRNESRFWH